MLLNGCVLHAQCDIHLAVVEISDNEGDPPFNFRRISPLAASRESVHFLGLFKDSIPRSKLFHDALKNGLEASHILDWNVAIDNPEFLDILVAFVEEHKSD